MSWKRALKTMIAATAQPTGRDTILLFHSVGPGGRYSTPPAVFARQVAEVERHAGIVPVRELLDGTPASGNLRTALTFDDGYADNYECAFAMLSPRQIPFTIFLTTAFLSGAPDTLAWSPHYAGLPPLTWQQVREMHRHGVTFGSHTHTHRPLSACSDAQLRRELSVSKRIIEDELGAAVELLSFPFGQPHDFDERTLAIAAECGYRWAFTTLQRSLRPVETPLAVPRIIVDTEDAESDVRQKVLGQRDFVAPVAAVRSFLVRTNVVKPFGAGVLR